MRATLVVEKWQVRPEPKWILLREEEITAQKVTPKRFYFRRMVFDRETGREIKRRDWRLFYKFSIRAVRDEE